MTAMGMPEDALRDLDWRKATFSISNGACVEVGAAVRLVAVRDSTDQAGPHLTYSAAAWRNFAQAIQRGHIELQG